MAVGEFVFVGITKLQFCFQKVGLARKIQPVEVDPVVHPPQGMVEFFPPDVEIAVGQFEQRRRVNIPALLQADLQSDAVAFVPTQDIDSGSGENAEVHQAQAVAFERGAELFYGNGITSGKFEFAEDQVGARFLVALDIDVFDIHEGRRRSSTLGECFRHDNSTKK